MHTTATDPTLARTIILSFEAPISDPKLHSDEGMEIHTRPAKLDDVGDIAHVILKASELEPAFRYKYPHSKKYPDDSLKCTIRLLRTYINNTDPLWRWLVMVAETPLADGSLKTISVAVWEISVFDKRRQTQEAALPGSLHDTTLGTYMQSYIQHSKPPKP
jgi:hypothetical protein